MGKTPARCRRVQSARQATQVNMNRPGRQSSPANESSNMLRNQRLPRLSRAGRHPTTRSTRRHRSRRNGKHDSHGNHRNGSHHNGSPKPFAGSRRCRHFPCRKDGRWQGSRQQFLLRQAVRIATAKNSVFAEYPRLASSMRKHRLRAKRSTRQRPMPAPRLWRHASA